eukprot:symbB.v1.2.039254.t1/scaffold6443.1/size18076/1
MAVAEKTIDLSITVVDVRDRNEVLGWDDLFVVSVEPKISALGLLIDNIYNVKKFQVIRNFHKGEFKAILFKGEKTLLPNWHNLASFGLTDGDKVSIKLFEGDDEEARSLFLSSVAEDTVVVSVYDDTADTDGPIEPFDATLFLGAPFKHQMKKVVKADVDCLNFQIITSAKDAKNFTVKGSEVGETATVREELDECQNPKEILALVLSKVDALQKRFDEEYAKDKASEACKKALSNLVSVKNLQKILEALEDDDDKVPDNVVMNFLPVSLAGEAEVVGKLQVVIPADNGTWVAVFDYSKYNHANDVFQYFATHNNLPQDRYTLNWGTDEGSSKLEGYDNLLTHFGKGGRVYMHVRVSGGGSWSVLKHITKPDAVRALKSRANDNMTRASHHLAVGALPDVIQQYLNGKEQMKADIAFAKSQNIKIIKAGLRNTDLIKLHIALKVLKPEKGRKGQGEEKLAKVAGLLFNTLDELQNVVNGVMTYRADYIKFLVDVAIDEYAEFHEQDGEAKIKIDALYEDVKSEVGRREDEQGAPQTVEGRNCTTM